MIDTRRIPFRMLLLILVVLGIARGVAPAPVAAVVSVGVTPSVVQLEAGVGAEVERELTVSNEGDEPLAATTGVTILDGAGEARGAASWVTVDPPRIELDPEERQVLTVTVDVPADLASGGYYAVVTVTTASRAVQGGGAAVVGEVGVPILITVDGEGEATTAPVVERFAAVLESDGRTGFRAEIRNDGNTHAVLRGTLESDDDDAPIEDVAFRGPTLLLPGATVVLEGRPSQLLESGRTYRVAGELDYGALDPLPLDTTFTAEPPAVELRAPIVCTAGEGVLGLRLELANEGDIGVAPTATITRSLVDAGTPGVPTELELPVAWPNDVSRFMVEDLGELEPGTYELTVALRVGTATSQAQTVTFKTGGNDQDAVEACGSIVERIRR